MEILTKFIDQFAVRNSIEAATRVVLGDFNVEGHSPVCNHLRASGYYSCFEVCPPANRGLTPVSLKGDSTTPTTAPICTDSSNASDTPDPEYSDSFNADTISALHIPPSAVVCGRPGQHIVTHHSDVEAEQENEICEDSAVVTLGVVSAEEEEEEEEELVGDDRPVVSSAAPLLHHHQYCSVTPMDYFVSHHTHKEEDLGVDHIFIRPELLYSTEGKEERGQLREGVFVAASQVLPASLSCSEWPLDFASISDHRPVQASIVFGKNENLSERMTKQ
jgi:hypothetical protein